MEPHEKFDAFIHPVTVILKNNPKHIISKLSSEAKYQGEKKNLKKLKAYFLKSQTTSHHQCALCYRQILPYHPLR